jgi:peptidoglycan/xylan/chitin deacetylase (PgdA/CDA1 family)
MWVGDPSGDQVYLTFDDGPVPGVTDYVLNELAKRNQKATFFMVGDNVRKHSSLASEVVAQGHHIGNHTFNHLKGWTTSDSEYVENVGKCDWIFEEKLGLQTGLFRPPYGLIRNSQAQVILKSKKIIMWNVLSGDYDRTVPATDVLNKSIQNTRSGSILLFHDQLKTREVLRKVLPDFLDYLTERGFETSFLK